MNTVVTNTKWFNRLVKGLHIILLFGILGFAPHDEAALTEIRRVSFASRADGKGIVIRLHAKAPLNAYSEPQFDGNNTVEVTLFNAKLATSYRSDSPFDPVVDLDVKESDGHLIFHFSLDKAIQIETSAYPDQSSNDLLLGITYVKDNRALEVAESADRGEELPEINTADAAPLKKVESKPVAKVEAETPDVAKPEPQSVKNAASLPAPVRHVSLTAAEKAERWTLDTVVIDAGHGGHDSGAVANGVMEKDINLAVALRLGSYLEKLLKVNVVYTRTEDEFVELQERGHIANQAGAKLFISIHANSAPYSSTVRGTETYILGLHRTEKAKEVMERENEVINFEDNPDQYNAFYQNGILRTLALSANLRMSEKLAGEIESQFADRARRQSRGVKQAGLIVLWAASMPAVLVELGYLTNRFEAAYLNSEQGQDYLASAIFRAVRDFKYEYEKGLNLSAAN